MLKLSHLAVGLILCLPFADTGATAYKCMAGKKITYANIPCEELGLTSIGPVKNLVTVMPATPVPRNNIEAANGNADDNKTPKDSGIKPATPPLKKLLN